MTMIRKIVLSILLAGLIGILVAGAVIRTVDKAGQVAEARGAESGQGYGRATGAEGEDCDEKNGGGEQGQSNRGGQGGGAGSGGGAYGQGTVAERPATDYEDWTTYEGTVVQAPEDGQDLVIQTTDGEEIVVGTGPGYMKEQGFVLQAGEQVQVRGMWEGSELEAAQLTRLRDGQTITLRDASGRPAWAGGGRRAQGDGQTGYGGAADNNVPGDGTGTGQAQVDEWVTLQGSVVSVDEDALVVQAGGEQIVVENRPWWFAQEQGFSAQVGDQVVMVGFYENGDFEVGQLSNATSGQVVDLREENGRPGWAGSGRRGG
jgi:hypothetical protein